MATISIEFGKESSQQTREVYLLVRQGLSDHAQHPRKVLGMPQTLLS